jgi:predicted nucleotidyltransferase
MDIVRTNIVLSKEIYEKLRQEAFNRRRTMSDLVREAVDKQLGSSSPALSLDEIKAKAIPVLQAAGVKRAALFGSYARGDNRPDSDVDILVELPKGLSLLDVVSIKLQLEQQLQRSVDLVEYHTIKPRIRASVLQSQIPIL